jgi:hypothetical protein
MEKGEELPDEWQRAIAATLCVKEGDEGVQSQEKGEQEGELKEEEEK